MATLRNLGLMALAVITIALCYLAITSVNADPPTSRQQESSDAAAQVDAGAPPEIADQVRADFATVGDLPAGSRTYDNPAAGSPLSVRDGGLTHDGPVAPVAVGSVEVKLDDPVQKIGARMSFPASRPGSVNLVAWSSSLIEARVAGQPVPDSGLRLEVTADFWQLTVHQGDDSVIAGDEYVPAAGSQTFEVYRSGARAWVVDPSGKLTMIDNPAVESLAGPWACWQLQEDAPGTSPASLQEIWAG